MIGQTRPRTECARRTGSWLSRKQCTQGPGSRGSAGSRAATVHRKSRFRVLTWSLVCAAAVTYPADGSAGGFMGRAADRDARGALERLQMSATATFASAWAEVHESDELRQAVRLVPAGEPVGESDGVLARIRAHLERYGVTPATLAKVLDVKPAVVTLLLNDPDRIPAGPRATLLRDGERWCAADAHERELRRARIIPTAVTRLVGGIARAVRETKTIGLIVGTSGLGKSHALDAVRAELPGQTIIVRASPDGRGVRGLLRAIGTAANAGPAATLMPSVKAGIQCVRGSAGLLAIDEAHLVSVLALEAARAIFDQADVGLLLVGTSALRRTLNPAADPMIGPLCSRVALRVDLDAELLAPGRDGRPRPWIDAATVKAIIERHVSVRIEGAGMVRLVRAANFSAGRLRAAVNGARIASYLVGRRGGGADLAVSEADIAAALEMGQIEGS